MSRFAKTLVSFLAAVTVVISVPGLRSIVFGKQAHALTTSLVTGVDTPITSNFDSAASGVSFDLVSQPTNGAVTFDAASGIFTYTPNAGFVGNESFLFTETGTDPSVAPVTGDVSIDVLALPTAAPGQLSAAPGDTISSVSLTTDGSLGLGSNLTACLLDAATNACGDQVLLANASFGLDPVSGIVTVAVSPTAPYGALPDVTYMVTDPAGQSASSVLSVTVTPHVSTLATSVAVDDSSTGSLNAPQSVDLLANDAAANGAGPFDSTTLYLCDSGEAPPTCTAAGLTTAGGDFVINGSKVTFTPATNFVGDVTVSYQVNDALGTTVNASYVAHVASPTAPHALGQSLAVLSGSTVDFAKLIGVGGLATGDALTACLVSSDGATCGNSVSVAAGTYALDPTTNIVTFAALANAAAGAADPVTYRVTDALNQSASATLTAFVAAPLIVPPLATNAAPGTVVTFHPLASLVSNALNPIDISSLRLCAVGVSAPACASTSVTTSAGTFTIGAQGAIVFTPAANFNGTTAPVTYQVTDALGQLGAATLTVTEQRGIPRSPSVRPTSGHLAFTGSSLSHTLLVSVILIMSGGLMQFVFRRRS